MSTTKIILLDYRTALGDLSDFDSVLDIYFGYLKKNKITAEYWQALVDPENFEKDIIKIFSIITKIKASRIAIIVVNPWLLKELQGQLQKQLSIAKIEMLYSYKGEPSATFDSDQFCFQYFDFTAWNHWLEKFTSVPLPYPLQTSENIIAEVLQKRMISPKQKKIFKNRHLPRPVHRELLAGLATCGYVAGLKNNPAYENLKLPLKVASKKGCSFCEFDPPPYAKSFNKEQLVKSHVLQITQTLQKKREVKIFISHDQLFLNYFDLILLQLKKNKIDELDFYMSSRISYINHNLNRIETILSQLAGSKIRLIFHLIGFENFSQRQLDLMNKGQKVASILKCLAHLGQLAEKFPENFSAKTGTHGFILFTPWLSFSELQENHRYLQQFDFHLYCTNYYLRKMRLTANLPIYYKAKQDGLLQKVNKSDYAKKIAYEEDIGWKFQDPNVALVYALCERYAKFKMFEGREILSRAILQIENLRNFPEQCRFDLKVACSFNTPCLQASLSEEATPKVKNLPENSLMRQTQFEKISFLLKQRKLIKWERKKHEEVNLKKLFPMSQYLQRTVISKGNPRNNRIVFIAKEQAILERAVDLERQMHGKEKGYDSAATEMGELLGYPSCCRESYLRQRQNLDLTQHHDSARFWDLLSKDQGFICPMLWPENGIISHFPCSFGCSESITMAQDLVKTFLRQNQSTPQDFFRAITPKLIFWSEAKSLSMQQFFDRNQNRLKENKESGQAAFWVIGGEYLASQKPLSAAKILHDRPDEQLYKELKLLLPALKACNGDQKRMTLEFQAGETKLTLTMELPNKRPAYFRDKSLQFFYHGKIRTREEQEALRQASLAISQNSSVIKQKWQQK